MKEHTQKIGGVFASALVALGLFIGVLSPIPPHWLYDASVVELFLMLAPANLFPILYTAFFPWWQSPLGRALFTKALGLMLLIDISVLYQLFGDNYDLREQVRFIVFTLVLLGMSYQLVVIIKIKLQARGRREDGRDAVRMS